MPTSKKINGEEQLREHHSQQRRKGAKKKPIELKMDGMDPANQHMLLEVAGNDEVVRIRAHECFPKIEDLKMFLRKIHDNPQNKKIKLDIKHNKSDVNCTKVLTRLVREQRISVLRTPEFDNDNLYRLLRAIAYCDGQIKILDLARNRLDDNCTRRLKRAIKGKKITKELDLSGCWGLHGPLTHKDRREFKQAHQYNKTLKIQWFKPGDLVEYSDGKKTVLEELSDLPGKLNPTLDRIKSDKGREKITLAFFKTVTAVTSAWRKKGRRKDRNAEYASSESSNSEDSMSSSSSSSSSEDEDEDAVFGHSSDGGSQNKPGKIVENDEQMKRSPSSPHSPTIRATSPESRCQSLLSAQTYGNQQPAVGFNYRPDARPGSNCGPYCNSAHGFFENQRTSQGQFQPKKEQDMETEINFCRQKQMNNKEYSGISNHHRQGDVHSNRWSSKTHTIMTTSERKPPVRKLSKILTSDQPESKPRTGRTRNEFHVQHMLKNNLCPQEEGSQF